MNFMHFPHPLCLQHKKSSIDITEKVRSDEHPIASLDPGLREVIAGSWKTLHQR
jgi:hypothetical protein